MKTLTQYITEASTPVKEFETALGLKFPSKAKVKDGILTFDMTFKKYYDWDGWYATVFLNVYNKQSKNLVTKTVKDESELEWDFGADAPKGNEKWISIYTLKTPNSGTYEMIEIQVCNHRTGGKDHIYIAIKKV